MKKSVKLTVLVAVLAVCIIGYVILENYLKNQNGTDTPDTTDTTVTVLKIKADDIVSIEFESDKEQISLKKTDGKWGLTDDADFPISSIYTNYMETALSTIYAKRVIAENLDNESDFGMSAPQKEIKFVLADGTEYLYTIGSYNSATSGSSFKLSGQNKIYIADSEVYDTFSFSLYDMIEYASSPAFDAEDIVNIEYILDGKSYILTDDSDGVGYYSDAYNYFYITPDGVKVAADGECAADLLNAVAGISLGKVAEYKSSADRLNSLGLGENKAFVLKFTYKEAVSSDSSSDANVSVSAKKDYLMYVGRFTEEDSTVKYYAMLDGSYILYELNKGEELFKAIDADFESKLACPILLEDVIAFDVTVGSDKYTYGIDDIEKSEKVKKFFNSLNSLVSEGYPEKDKGDTLMAVTFDVGGVDVEFTVYKYDDNSFVASFDKKEDVLVSAEKVNGILESLK